MHRMLWAPEARNLLGLVSAEVAVTGCSRCFWCFKCTHFKLARQTQSRATRSLVFYKIFVNMLQYCVPAPFVIRLGGSSSDFAGCI